MRFGLVLLVVLWVLPSCATVDYLPPTQGTSAELQSVLAQSLEVNMKGIHFDPAEKTVEIHVHVLGGHQRSVGLERYVQSLFREWVIAQGGKVGPGQFRMEVFLPVLGTTATRRDLSYSYVPLYYSERLRTSGQLTVLVKDQDEKVVGLWRGGEGGEFTDMYLMRMFGPFDVPEQSP